MTKNTTGGKKHKKAKNYVKVEKLVESDNEFQFYAKVNKKLGGGNFSVDVFIPEKKEKKMIDGVMQDKIVRYEELRKEQLALIRGSIRKRCRIDVGNLVLVSLRDFEVRKVDIIHAYKNDDFNVLRRQNKLPKCKIFENDEETDINFGVDDNEIVHDSNKSGNSSYTSNHDLIPDLDEEVSEDEIDNI
jgi:translation initiation factor IF-1